MTLVSTATLNTGGTPVYRWTSPSPVPIPDDSVSIATMSVTNCGLVEAMEVGVRIDHPRVSDLALTLVSPGGLGVLLQENRGGLSRDGVGTDVVTTTVTNVSYTGGAEAVNNVFPVGHASGIARIDYDFYALPDTIHVYYETNLLFDSGLVSSNGTATFNFGPGAATSLVVVMKEGKPLHVEIG